MSFKLTEDEKSRLSKKAQRYVAFLEQELEVALMRAQRLNDLHFSQADSSVSYVDLDDSRLKDVLLPEESQIHFKLKDPESRFPDKVRARKVSEDTLEVSGDSGFVIYQSASNVLNIKIRNWRDV